MDQQDNIRLVDPLISNDFISNGVRSSLRNFLQLVSLSFFILTT